MSQQLQEFVRQCIDEFLLSLSPEERLKGLPAEVRLKGLPAEERGQGLTADELLHALSPEIREALARQLTGNGASANLQ